MYLFILLLAIQAFSQGGLLRESLSMDSERLGRKVEYSVYLPQDYEKSNRSYPILYLLHGYTDDETGWTQFGEVKSIADRFIGNAEVAPMVIVMPDAGLDWYINSYDDKIRYEDFFFDEFIPFIEDSYRIRTKKEFRAVAGLSMGGHGSLIYAMKHPELFAACAPLSAAVWTEEGINEISEEYWKPRFEYIFGPAVAPNTRVNDCLKQNTAYFLAESTDAELLKQVRYYIDCGDDDFLINGNMALHKLLNEKDVPHEFRVRDGAHNWTYWRTALPEVLKFVSESFHR